MRVASINSGKQLTAYYKEKGGQTARDMTSKNLVAMLDKTQQIDRQSYDRLTDKIKEIIILSGENRFIQRNTQHGIYEHIKERYTKGYINDLIIQSCIYTYIQDAIHKYLEAIQTEQIKLYPDEKAYANIVAYALKHALIDDKDIDTIPFDHGQTPDTFIETYYVDLVDKVYQVFDLVEAEV